MPNFTEKRFAIGALVAFALWIFVVLPIYYGPPGNRDQQANQCSSEQYKNYGFWEKTRCDPVAYFTLWLVGFTGILGISTIGLWWVSWRGGKRQSADMQDSIRLARQEFETAYRARVSMMNVRFEYGGGRPKISMTFSLENTGQLPATDCALISTRSSSIRKDFHGPDVDHSAADEQKVKIVIGSRESKHEQVFFDEFRPQDYANSASGGAYLRIGVTLLYRDGLGNDRMTYKFFQWRGERGWRDCGSHQD